MTVDQSEIDEHSDVDNDENILRRIPNVQDYFDASLQVPITRNAFIPNAKDTKGISLYRERFATPQQVAESGRNPRGYYIARLSVGGISQLDLTVIPDPIHEDDPTYLPGHAAIPQINIHDYKKSKTEFKEVALKLATLASKAIAYSPKT